MIVRIPLIRIRDNPFQTRTDYDDVSELADSLLKLRHVRSETSGLLHVPPGRIVCAGQVLDPGAYGNAMACQGIKPEAVVELAAGHRRLRAFMQLAAADYQEYATFPVDVVPLNDQAMADVAWEENAKRKDLSPIEEAEALQRAMTRFCWTQAEVGRRWGLSQSAVANKLRLLGLPDDAQVAIRAGQLSERHGRALLTAAGKSRCIYQAVAAELITRPVSDGAHERALACLTRGNFHSRDEMSAYTCEACGQDTAGPGYYTIARSDGDERGEYIYLCPACYRAATNWTPPSAAEADRLVEQATYRYSVSLARSSFPHDVAIGASCPGNIVSLRCADCSAREMRNSNDLCLDRRCYEDKRRFWELRQSNELHTRLCEMYPDAAAEDKIRISNTHGGYVLRISDQVDCDMVAAGYCGPHCERLDFYYVHWEGATSSYIHPFEELPFAYRCNNSNSHLACQRRYLAAQQTDDEQTAEVQLKNSVAANRQAAQSLLDRARLSVARALLDGHTGAWLQLAQCFGSGEPKSLDDALARAASRIVGWNLDCHHDWSRENTPDEFRANIKRILSNLGIALLPDLDDVTRRLERIEAFVLSKPRADLTPEQVRGNQDNLRKLQAEFSAMLADGRISSADIAPMTERIEYLFRALDISREIIGISDTSVQR